MSSTASTAVNWNHVTNTSVLVLTKPSQASFRAAMASVNTTVTIIAVLIVGALAGLVSRLTSGDIGTMIFGLVVGAIGGAIGYYFLQAILWVFARLFGGRGTLVLQANLQVTFLAPLTLLNAILSIIPSFGFLLSLVVAIYELVLLTTSLKVVHEYSTGKAVLTWLVPAVVAGLLIGILVVALGMLILGALSSISG